MSLLEDLFEPLGGHVGIYLSGRQRGVPEQLLDLPQIRAAF